MIFGSVCSGIEAASVAFAPLGWKAAWLSEIEAFPSAVLAHHYPDVPNLGDMTTLPDRIRSGEVEAPDILCGGTPCQAFSVAGKRESLADARGNLSLTFCEIADAIDATRSVRAEQPAIILWENVPGVLSTKDNAFGCFLAQLCGGDEPLVAPDGWPDAGCVSGPQRTAAWRVLDAQYFGLAQRRRRVFVVASARDGFDPAAVLFESEGVRRDHPPRREAGEGTAADAQDRAAGRGAASAAGDRGHCPPISPALKARDHKGPSSDGDGDGDGAPLIAHTLRGDGFDASEDGTGRGTPLVPVAASACFPCAGCGKLIDPGWGWGEWCDYCGHQHIDPPVPVTVYGGGPREDRPDGGFYVRMNEPTCKTLDAASGLNPTASQGGVAVLHPVAIRTANTGANGHGIAEDVTHTLDGANGQAIAFAIQERAVCENPNAGLNGAGFRGDGSAYTLEARQTPQAVSTGMQVRRLTPVECERLQGFPDGYTAIPWRNKPAADCPDGPRYKALGNSWAVPCVRWIGERIAQACQPRLSLEVSHA